MKQAKEKDFQRLVLKTTEPDSDDYNNFNNIFNTKLMSEICAINEIIDKNEKELEKIDKCNQICKRKRKIGKLDTLENKIRNIDKSIIERCGDISEECLMDKNCIFKKDIDRNNIKTLTDLSNYCFVPESNISKISLNQDEIHQRISFLNNKIKGLYNIISKLICTIKVNKKSEKCIKYETKDSDSLKIQDSNKYYSKDLMKSVDVLQKKYDERYVKKGPLTDKEYTMLRKFDDEIISIFLTGDNIDSSFLLDEITLISSYYFKRLYDYCESLNIETYSIYEIRNKIFKYKTKQQNIIFTVPSIKIWTMVHKELVANELLFTLDGVNYSFDEDEKMLNVNNYSFYN